MATPVFVMLDNNTNVTGNRREVFGFLVLTDTYVTGGLGFDPSQLGLAILDRFETDVGRNQDGTLAFDARMVMATRPGPVDPMTDAIPDLLPVKSRFDGTFATKLQAFWCAGAGAALEEVDNGADLSEFTVHFTAWGV